MTRRELVDELTATLGGARHEARFVVEEVLGGARGGGPATWCRPRRPRRRAG